MIASAVPSWCKVAIDVWTTAARFSTGHVFRPLNKAGRLNASRRKVCFTSSGSYGRKSACPSLQRPEALVRQNRAQGGAALEQTEISRGHESIVTTSATCDHLGIHPKNTA